MRVLGQQQALVFSLSNGTSLWNCTQCNLPSLVYPAAVFSPDSSTLFTVGAGGTLYALGADTGAVRWASDLGANTTLPLAYAGSPAAGSMVALVGCTSSSAVTAVHVADGAVAWTYSDPASASAPSHVVASLTGDTLYVSWGPTVASLGVADGALLWSLTLDGEATSLTLGGAASGLPGLFVASTTGAVYAFKS